MKNNIPCFKIKDIAEIVTGTTPRTSDLKNYGGDIKFITPKELDVEKYVYHSATTISKKGLSSSRLIPKNSLLVSCIGNIGKIAISGCDLVTNQQINTITFRENVDVSYAYYCFDSMRTTLHGMATSTTLPILNKSRFSEIKIPLPPLAEQRRIAAILDKADAIRRKRQQSLELADSLLKSVFLDMFGDPVTNPKGWDVVKLNDIADIASGVTKGRKLEGQQIFDVPYMRVANVKDGYIDLSEIKSIPATQRDIKVYSLQYGDVLLTEGGDPDKLGRGALWTHDIPQCIHQNHIFRVRISSTKSDPIFFAEYLRHRKAKLYFLRCAKQTTGIASVNMRQLKALPVLLPPRFLLENFSKIHAIIDKKNFQQKQYFLEADHTFKSLQQSFFG